MLSIFSCDCCLSKNLLEKCLFRSSAHLKIRLFIFWYLIVWDVYIFHILTLISHIIWKYFVPFSGLSFHFVNSFCCCAKACKFNYFTFISVFVSFSLGDTTKTTFLQCVSQVFCLFSLLGVLWFPVLYLDL